MTTTRTPEPSDDLTVEQLRARLNRQEADRRALYERHHAGEAADGTNTVPSPEADEVPALFFAEEDVE